MTTLRFLSLVVLAVWIGGLAVLGGVVAPGIFAGLEAHDPVAGRELAGLLFGQLFDTFQVVSWVCGGLLLALLGARAALGPRPRRLSLRVWTVLVMLAISVGTSLMIVPRIDRLRASVPGPIASLAPDDPRRVQFGQLHGASNGLMLVTLLAGLALCWFEARDGA
jgi:hypothetical protein